METLQPPSKVLILKGEVAGKPLRQTLKGGRLLIGRARVCDVIINDNRVSSIHAVLEVSGDHVKVYDMHSTNGTFVNGQKVPSGTVQVGGTISLGPLTLELAEPQADVLPPVLDMLGPAPGLPPKLDPGVSPTPPTVTPQTPSPPPQKKWKPLPKIAADLPSTPILHKVQGEEAPRVVYPLAADPKADYTEYIFEDLDKLYPIFKYDVQKRSIEVLINFKDKIFSVDYLPHKNGTIHLKGEGGDFSKDIELPSLGKKESLPFIDINNGTVSVNKPFGFEVYKVGHDNVKQLDVLPLGEDDILKFRKSDIEIYVRDTDKPPKISSPPIMRRDPAFRRYLSIVMLLMLSFIGLTAVFEVDKEIEEEKRPERIATILYKRKLIINEKKAVAKTKKAPKKIQKSPEKVKRVPDKPKNPTTKAEVEKPKVKEAKPKAVKKKGTGAQKTKVARSETKQRVVDKVKANPNKNSQPKKGSSSAKRRASQRAKSTSNSNAKGRVSAYKSPNLKSSLNNLLAKGGSTKGVKAFSKNDNSIGNSQGISGGQGSEGLKRSKVSSDINLTATTKGLNQTKGAEGLVSKKSIFTVGIPAKTVILGSIDPDDIKRILREHIPNFQACYQNSLNEAQAKFSGVAELVFSIGASGHVTQAGLGQKTTIRPGVKKCVLNVLRGIVFPEPLGGGSVSVKQSINFYPVEK